MRVSAPGLHVLMTADAVGGVWTYALDLAEGLAADGVGVTLAVLGPAPSDAQMAQAEAAGCRLRVTGLPLDWTAPSPEALRAAGLALDGIARETKADLVHLHSPAFADAIDGPVVAVCHSCVATWWASVESGPLPADLAWRADLVARGCRQADALIAPSHAFAAATARAYGLTVAPEVVHNGRRPAGAAPFDREPAPFALTAGRLWDWAKNAAALDAAAALARLPIRAAGPTEGPNGDRVALPHLDRLGTLDAAALAAQFARRPIFVSMARYEPFGLAVLEAAQAGCALVLSDIPTFRELWDGAASFVDPDNAESLARTLDTLAADRPLRAALGAAARLRAGRYGVAAMVSGTRRVFDAVLEERQRIPAREGAAA